jgi:oligopeptide transport system substrate-binding protein
MFPISSRAQEEETHPICSGPFQLEFWKKNDEILLKKNPWCTSHPTSFLNGVHFRIIPDPKKAFQLFENDQLDWIGDPISPLPVKYLPTFLLTKKIKPILSLTSCWFNTLSFPFSNLNLRKAFSLSIPRKEILDKLFLPNAQLTNRILPITFEGDRQLKGMQNCPTAAKRLFKTALDELNVCTLNITFSFEDIDEFSTLAKLLKDRWEKLFKIHIQLEPLSFKALWARLPIQQFEMTLFRPNSQYTDIINSLERFEFKDIARNFSGWENRKFQALLKQYRKTACQEKRKNLALQAEAVLLKEMPIAPIYYYHFSYLQKEHVKNLPVSPIGVVHFDRAILSENQNSLPLDFPLVFEGGII